MMDLVAREIHDREEWNDLVLGLPNYDLRQGYEWGEVRREVGWVPHRYAVFNGGRCIAAISILRRQMPGIGCSILYAPRGPLVDQNGEADLPSLIPAIQRVAMAKHAIFLRLSPGFHHNETIHHRTLVEQGFDRLEENWTSWNTPRIIMTLDVSLPEEDLRKRLRKRIGQYLGRAVKAGAIIERDASPEAIRRLHNLLVKASKRKRLPVHTFPFFETVRREYLIAGQGILLLCRYSEIDLAGLLAVRFGQKAYLLYSGIDTDCHEARVLHPGPTLYWELIRWAKGAGCETLDLGGSGTNFPPREDDPGFGLYQFKLGFGSSLDYMMGYYDLVFRRKLYYPFRFAERRLLPAAWKFRARLNK